MKIAAIICEYNPFHNGHFYHIKKTRDNGATHIIALMSGNYVQRGEPALLSKKERVKMALMGGVDLVLELPLPWAIGSAKRFARGAIDILNSLGCVDILSFGSESGDAKMLNVTAKLLLDNDVNCAIADYLKEGMSYPSAREKAARDYKADDLGGILNSPNDVLGVEYCTALLETYSKIKPCVIARYGAVHDGKAYAESFLSASEIRKRVLELYRKNSELKTNIKNQLRISLCEYMPKYSLEILVEQIALNQAPVDYFKEEMAVLAVLRRMKKEDFLRLPDVSEGLENRIYSAVKSAVSLDELFSMIKTKRYTHSRLRRIILCAFLGVEAGIYNISPPYIRVLGINDKGKEIMRKARKTAIKPVIMRGSDTSSCGKKAKDVFEIEARGTDLFNLLLPTIKPCGYEYTNEIVLIK